MQINKTKNIIFIIFFNFLIFTGFSQNYELVNAKINYDNTFLYELNYFINKCNAKGKASMYYVYVVRVYPLNNQKNCIGYTVSYIINYWETKFIQPQLYYSDSINLVVVMFDDNIEEKSIRGLPLKKIENIDIITKKISPEDDDWTGTSEAFIYNDCGGKKEIINYRSSDFLPQGKHIYGKYFEINTDGFQLNKMDSIIKK